MSLSIECIESTEGLGRVEAELIEFLEQHVEEPDVMHDPRVITAFIHRESGRSSLLCLLLRRDGRLIGFAPCFVYKGRFSLKVSVLKVLRLKARVLKCCGNRLAIAREEEPSAVVREVFAALRGKASRFDYILLEELILPNPLHEAFVDQASVGGFRALPVRDREEKAHFHLLHSSFEAYQSSVGSKRRNDMKRSTRAYRAADGVRGRVDCVTRAEDVEAFLEAVDRVSQNTWQSRLNGYVPRNTAAEREYHVRIAELGRLRGYVLREEDGKPVAFVTGQQANGTLLLEDVGYDMDARDSHPGVSLLYFLLQNLYESETKPRMLDFGYGDNRYKAALATGSRAATALYLATPGWYWLLMRAQPVLDALDATIRERIKRAGLESKVRGWLKRGRAAG